MAHTPKNVVIALALSGAALFAVWLRVRSHLAHGGEYSDGERVISTAGDDGVRYAVWGRIAPLPARVNVPGAKSRPALAPDGRFLVFALGERGLDVDLYAARIENGERGEIGEPCAIASVNSAGDDCAPAFSGTHLYFASDRAGGAGGLDLYRATYVEGVFGVPERLDAALQSSADDTDPAPLASAAGALAFASNRKGTDFDLYAGELMASNPGGAWKIAPIEALNSRHDEREPAFTADAGALFFASDRQGSFDLFRSARSGEVWLEPLSLAALDTPASERGPCPSADGFSLTFVRAAESGATDLCEAHSIELFRLPGRSVGWMDIAVIAALLMLALLAFLARRWPALDILYKCFLVSVIAHLLLLWWFRGLYMEGGALPLRGEDGRHKVRLLPSESSAIARLSERHGEVSFERASAAREAVPREAVPSEKAALDLDALAASEQPRSEPLSAPVRPAQPATASAHTPGNVSPTLAARAMVPRLSDAEDPFEKRSGSAPELTLQSRESKLAREDQGSQAPQRASAGVDGKESPSSGMPVVVAHEPIRADASRRAGVDRVSAAPGSAPRIAVAQPSETREVHGGDAPELALEPGAIAASARGDAPAPARLASSGDAPQDGRGASPPSSSPLQLSARGSDDGRAPARSAANEIGQAPAGVGNIVLHDREARGARVPVDGPGQAGASTRDLSAALVPTDLAARDGDRRAAEASAPSRWSDERARDGARDDKSPEFRPLALEKPPDRGLDPGPRRTWEHTPYQNRIGEEKLRALEQHGGTVETERAVAQGLAYLASIQARRGNWGHADARDDKYGEVAVGKTGLCLLAFLGAGHTQASSTQYSKVVTKALAYLLAAQDEASGHLGDSEAYSHGIATYALAECLALTGDEALRAPLESAVGHILAAQSQRRDPRLFGGWSYYYSDDRVFDRWPRTSITAWQVMALESARLSGIAVPDRAFTDARAFLTNARDEEGGFYRYNHDPSRLGSEYPTLPASTPAGLFALSLLGEDIGKSAFAAPRAFVMNRAPSGYRYTSDAEFVSRAQGNLYFWYYGTLAMFRAGGPGWDAWNEAMKKTLLPAQQPNGSWTPIDTYARYARDDDRDRSYTTAMCVLSLEIYYRYYLPLLKVR